MTEQGDRQQKPEHSGRRDRQDAPPGHGPGPGLGPISVLVLLGLPGAGKSTVGRILAERLNWRFIDLDEEIAKTAGTTIAEIFRTRGEKGFRELERRLTCGLSSVRHAVLAPGGGWIANRGAREALPADAGLVWLRVSPEEAVRRVLRSGETRPLLAVADPVAAARALGEARDPLYAAADLTVDVDGRMPDAIAKEILEFFGLET